MNWMVAFLILLSPQGLGFGIKNSNRWIVWNIGQGLWITGVFMNSCFHIDAGGESQPPARLLQKCRDKENRLYLSHWDWDHIGGVKRLRDQIPRLCRVGFPGGRVTAPSKQNLINSLQPCVENGNNLGMKELHWKIKGKKPNDQSRVWTWKNRWLFPGDSPRTEELRWLQNLRNPHAIKILIAGHHGSRTSTSKELLSRLTGLRLVLISARQKVYGHPHPKMIERLQKTKTPFLRTEEWGHLIFEI